MPEIWQGSTLETVTSTNPPSPTKRKRAATVIASFLLLMVCLGSFNVLVRFAPAPPAPRPTPASTPETSPTAAITLLGPPDNSLLRAQDTLTVYWTWPLPLSDDQLFKLYLRQADQETLVGVLEEANMGQAYRLTLSGADIPSGEGPVQWLVKLESSLSDQPLISSTPRTILVLNKDR
jgi:hypothetical protein